jgi:hypothetical protein
MDGALDGVGEQIHSDDRRNESQRSPSSSRRNFAGVCGGPKLVFRFSEGISAGKDAYGRKKTLTGERWWSSSRKVGAESNSDETSAPEFSAEIDVSGF